MIKACEDVAQAAGWIDRTAPVGRISHSESAVIAAIRRHLSGQRKTDIPE
jgi:hypothetical protein